MASGTSYNGWPASDDKNAIGVVPFGDNHGVPFPGGVKSGDVFTVLGYVATQFNARVEPIVSGWDWGHSFKANVNNPSQLSCHASGTALDINAPDHPNGSSGTFTDAQVGAIYAILAEVSGAVDWLEGYDEMHFEIAVDSGSLSRIAAGLPSGGTPAPIPPTPTAPEDWFDDMATEADLTRIVDERLGYWLPRLLNVLKDGNENGAFPPGSSTAVDGKGIAHDTVGTLQNAKWGGTSVNNLVVQTNQLTNQLRTAQVEQVLPLLHEINEQNP